MEKYIFLGISVVVGIMFLFSRKTSKDCFSLMGIAVCFGLLGYFLEAYFFAYAIFFLGLIAGVAILSFELMLIEKEINIANKKENKEKIISGILLAVIFGMSILIFKKNENYFVLKTMESVMEKNVIGIIKENYFISTSLIMVFIFVSLVCIDLIIKREK